MLGTHEEQWQNKEHTMKHNLRRHNEKKENKDYIYTQATDTEGQVRTIKAGQTRTQVDKTRGINRTQVNPMTHTTREIGNRRAEETPTTTREHLAQTNRAEERRVRRDI